MSEKIYVFSLKGCSHCHNLKLAFNEHNIKFLDVDVDQNEKMWESVVEQTGYDYVPTIMIFDDENEDADVYIPSIDFENEEDMVKIINERKNNQGN